MTTSSTATKITLDVPSPWTKLELGEGTFRGVYVETDEHVRLYAHGDADSSDAVAMSVGQLWVQAVADVVGVAKNKAMLTSQKRTFVNSADGLTVLAGFKPSSIASETTPGTLPTGVDEYDSAATVAQGVWLGFGSAMLATSAVAAIAEMAIGSNFTWFGATSAAINATATMVNSIAAGNHKDSSYSALNLFSQGGTYVGCTFGATYVVGLAGAIAAAPFINTFGLFKAVLRGFKRASVTSCGNVDISALFGSDLKAAKDLTLSARTGDLAIFAPEVRLGTPNRKDTKGLWPVVVSGRLFGMIPLTLPNPQKVTETITLTGTSTVQIDSALGVDLMVRDDGLVPASGPAFKSFSAKDTKITGTTLAAAVGSSTMLCVGADRIIIGHHVTVRRAGLNRAKATKVNQEKARIIIDASGIQLVGYDNYSECMGGVVCTATGVTVVAADEDVLKIGPKGTQIVADEAKMG